MNLSFPGTRGEIDARTRLHWRHSCVLVEGHVLVDCGSDWPGKMGFWRRRPSSSRTRIPIMRVG
jgi:hypothetical protein